MLRKRISALIFALILMCLTAAPAFAEDGTSPYPKSIIISNIKDKASKVGVNNVIYGRLDGDENKYYTFEITDKSMVYIYGKISYYGSVYSEHALFEVFNSEGMLCSSFKISYDSDQFNFNTFCLEKGTYYLKVTNVGKNSVAYGVVIAVSEAGDSEIEYNGSRESANTIVKNKLYDCRLYSEDTDYFKLTVSQKSGMCIGLGHIFLPGSTAFARLTVYDSNEKTLASITSSNYDVEKWTDVLELAPGTYYIKIEDPGGGERSYTLLALDVGAIFEAAKNEIRSIVPNTVEKTSAVNNVQEKPTAAAGTAQKDTGATAKTAPEITTKMPSTTHSVVTTDNSLEITLSTQPASKADAEKYEIITDAVPGSAGSSSSAVPYGKFTYLTDENGSAIIVSYTGKSPNVFIPEEIDGKPVSGIESSAFSKMQIKEITVPKSCTKFGENAFGDKSTVTVKCVEGSAADGYARENGYNVVYHSENAPEPKSALPIVISGGAAAILVAASGVYYTIKRKKIKKTKEM